MAYYLRRTWVLCVVLISGIGSISAQTNDSLLSNASLEQCVQYALMHQPVIQQSLIDESITETIIKDKLSDWYPQLNFAYLFQHNFQLQKVVFQGNTIKLGTDNTSAMQVTLHQNLFNRDVLLASKTKDDVRTQVKQVTTGTKIEIAAATAKAFYDVLTTLQQIKATDEDIVRLERSLKDAYSRYTVGIADKTDYKRATIALNNANALRKSNNAALEAKMEYLKSLMGYPVSGDLTITYDSLKMENELFVDTVAKAAYSNRVEYQLLATKRKLQEANLRYNKWSYLPDVSLNGAYNLNFQDNSFSKLYGQAFPNSYAGLNISVPIFQGGKRKYNIRQQEWELKRMDWDMVKLQQNISTEYAQAMALYKSNLAAFVALKENVELAKEVYDVIELQYKSGVKTYLEVVAAETDLRTAKINYYDALNRLLSSKIDVQKAMGALIF
ncbi:MAG TPA: TolC family protein [Panacibacter sp.]|nr:TolC family protein [Panacibacter sp.]HNP46151.1 TolC family protein [Panacibacter sp.]